MADTFTFTIRPVADMSDIKANVGEIQKAFKSLKLPDKLSGNLDKSITSILKEFEKYETKVKEGINTSGDYRQVENSLSKINNLYQAIVKDVQDISKIDLSESFDLDNGEFKELSDQIKEIIRQLENVKIDPTKIAAPIEQLKKTIKNDKITGKDGIIDQLIGHVNKNEIQDAKKALADLEKYVNKISYKQTTSKEGKTIQKPGTTSLANTETLTSAITEIERAFTEAQAKGLPLEQLLADLRQRQDELKVSGANALDEFIDDVGRSQQETETLVSQLQKVHKEDFNFDSQVKAIDRQVQSYFGLTQILRKVGQIARDAFQTIKELDAAMTETAVVTNFSVGDMWSKLPLYTEQANKLGSSIKDVYEATTLYYQQGLNTTQSMGLAVETLKMARIAGMDAKDATDAMTAALRGFNLELNQTSAQRINDVYSELAAITASDTQEISTAMEKVASLAHNAGMELETTAAFLAQMIETTREAPENLGTALKTVVARFQEMKQDPTKLVDSEGVMLDANKVDKALKSIGVQLMDTNGEFRKLDDVFLEIAQRWDTLSMGQQRYIATMAAGSRQQSRFIAMMSNYSRTMELVDAAYDASGASQRQFEKTLEGLDAKINKLKNAWAQFAMGLMNNEILKGGIDLLTDVLDKINTLIDFLSTKAPDPFEGVTKSLTTLLLTLGGLGAARKLLSRGIESGVGWFRGEMSGKQAIGNLLFSPKNALAEAKAEKAAAEKAGKEAGSAFSIAYTNARDSILKNKPLPYTITPKVPQAIVEEYTWQEITDLGITDASWNEETGLFERINHNIPVTTEADEQIKEYGQSLGTLANKFYGAGAACQAFGNILQGTPLAPFGKALQIVGIGLQSFGGLAAKAATIYGDSIKKAGLESVGGFAAMKAGFTGVGAAAGKALLAIAPYAIAIAAVIGVGYLLYREFTRDKREMEALAEAAKASSDAFDNLKTATEELKSSIEEIRNSDSLFDGLVVGTTEWNLALVEANQQVLDLIKKYPMLQKYMTTDANGRMRISETGFKAVQDEQNKKLGQAQALDILTNAEHNAKLLEQEQKKIFKDEKITNTVAVTYEFDENGAATMYSELVESYDQLSEEGQQEWDSIQAKIDAESSAAREQAVRAALSANGELNNTIISLFGQNLDEVTKQFEGETNLDTIKYAYAEFIGGVYDPLTKALTDASGEDVNLGDDALKQIYPQIMALLQFQEQAPQVEAAVKSLGKSFDSLIGDREGNTFINDLLNNNLEADASAIDKFLDLSESEIEEILKDMSDAEVKAIMQSDTADKNDLINLLKTNANNLKQAQTQSYADAAVWYAKSKGMNARTSGLDAVAKRYANTITQGLTVGSADAVNKFMNQISQSFDSATTMAMGNNLFSALLGKAPDVQQSITELVNQVDWTSAIDRGQFYKLYEEGSDAFNKLTNDQKQFIKGQKKIDKELNLTGKQFEELVQSSDFLEILTEKWSDFTNETGKLDASGVEAMAKECGTLNKLLETGEFDAYQLATALNYFQDSGSFDGMTSAVLEAIKSFNSLDKLIGQVKKDVDEFQPGESYEQGMDAYRDYMDSLTEAYEHRKYSSADTLSYAQRFVGEDEWKTFVSQHGQSNKSAEKAIIDSLKTIFTDNEEDTTINILKRLANGKTLLGGEAEASDIFSAYYDELGNLKLKIDPKATRDDFVNALVKERGFTEEMARSFLLSLEGQDWGFLEDNLTKGFDLAGREGGIKAYIEGIRDRGQIPAGTPTSNVVFTEAELEALKSMGGYESIDEVIADLANQLGIAAENIQLFNTETEGAAEYLAKLNGTTNTTKEQTREQAVDFLGANKGVVDFTAVTQKLEQTGINATKALDMAIDMAHEAGVEQVKWGDKLVDVSDIINGDQFNEAVEKLEDDANWTNVGNIIADAIVNALAEAGIGNGKKDESDNVNNSKNLPTADSVRLDYIASLEVERNDLEKELENTIWEADRLKQRIDNIKEADPENPDLPILEESLARAEAKAEELRGKLGEVDNKIERLKDKTVNINVNYNTTGAISGPTAGFVYKGKNNYISPSGFYTGSAAAGRKGTIGPNNRGGLTLTGEKGFEIAWLPSENRSMILGAQGPQMVDLPSDATVWNHEQSKKIVKQKGIPMGSMTTGTYDTGSSGGSGSGSGSSSSSSSKDKDPKHSNWYKEEVLRFNLNQAINQITNKIEKTTKSISDTLKKLGATYNDIAKDVEKQSKLLNETIADQQKLRDSYKAELEWLANGNRQLWISLTNASNESQEISVPTSQFITGNADTGYSISYAAIENYLKANGFGGDNLIANAEALFNLLNQQISNLQSGLNNADKAIEDAKQKLQDLINQVKDAFFAWENELTKVYELTQMLEVADGRRGRLAAETSMLLAQVSAGYTSVANAASRLYAIQQDDIKLIQEQIELTQQQIEERKKELALLVTSEDELKAYNQIREDNATLAAEGKLTTKDQAKEQAAWEAYIAAALAESYVSRTQNADGTYTFDLNTEQLEKDRIEGRITQETYEAIKEGYDKMIEAEEALDEAITSGFELMSELYEQFNEHLKTMADLENNLINAFVNAAQLEVSKLETLNSTLTSAAKSVIDQVKKNIDARRKAEDNAKTESDIAKKQQRLNTLRANTGGGNAVEIAQLEKEIADAQQSYGRSLEDQMLSQMQTQADEAAKQRQEQIDLAKQQIEYNKQAGIYAAMADDLLDSINSDTTQDEIQSILASTLELGTGKWQSLIDEQEIKTQVAEALVANAGIIELGQLLGLEIDESTGQIVGGLNALTDAFVKQLTELNEGMMNVVANTTTTADGINTVNTTQPDITTNTIPSTGGSSSSGSTGSSSGGTTNPQVTYPYGKASDTTGNITNGAKGTGVKAIQDALNQLGYTDENNKKLDVDGIFGAHTNAAVRKFQKAMSITVDGIVGNNTRAKFKAKGYKHGGLADFTGPAWLDGTKAKPELILNAQDTKNFMILKDVLADAMRGINHIDRSETYNNPTEFNINVNVEKITSDYDVDRLTERIKRNIVKDATYRNVTQVRNFR